MLGALAPGGAGFERDPTVKQMLEYASTHMAERFSADPATQGSIHAALGRSWRTLGDNKRSVAQLREAARDYARAFGEHDELTLRTRYALVCSLAYAARGVLRFQRLQIEPALQAWRRADALQRKLHPDDAQQAAFIRGNLADATLRQGKIPEAITLLRAMLADPLLDASRVGETHPAFFRAMLARALRNLGRYDEALPLAQTAAATTERIFGPDDYKTLIQLSTVASIYDDAGDCPHALAVQRTVRQRMAAHYGETRQATLVETGNLGFKEYACGDREAGLNDLRKAERGLREGFGEDNVAAHSFRYGLAQALTEQGRYREALQMADGLNVAALTAGDSTPGWQHRLDALRGEILIGLGDTRKGRELIAAVLPELVALGTEEPEDIARLRGLLGTQPAAPAHAETAGSTPSGK
jgi:non-specific serine/threonine protein kinase